MQKTIEAPSMGPREQSVYFAALRDGRTVLDTNYVANLLDVSPPAAALLLSRLYQKRALERIGHGVYAVVSPDTLYERQHRGVDARTVIDALMQRAGLATCYYVGFQSAALLHGAAHQIPFELQVVVGRQRRPLIVGETRVQFISARRTAFFGIETRMYQDASLKISDRERTAIDLVDRPSLGGGIEEVARTLSLLLEGADARKLAAYAHHFGRQSTAQRLGFLIESLGYTELAEALTSLRSLVGTKVILLDPGGQKSGKVNHRWNLRENIDLIEID